MSKESALARVESLLNSTKSRLVLGIYGKPGVGKSSLTDYISKNFSPELVSTVSMDGFHLSNRVLQSLGRSDRKGAPDTFDVEGFVSLLRRIKSDSSVSIYFPIFDRTIEESIAGLGEIPPSARLVLVEGNYLCHDKDGWEAVSEFIDELWYLMVDDKIRLNRLIARHVSYGKSADEAEAWARGTDESNAVLIGKSATKADFTVELR